MKILFCVNRDLYANIALNRIFTGLAPKDEALVLLSEAVAGTRATGAALTFLRFYEQDLLNGHFFPQQEALSRTGEGELRSFEQLSHFYGFSMQGVSSLKQPETVQTIRDFGPDVIVSIRFAHIFKPEVLQIARLGVINLHSGLLPEYRGILATFWSLLHGRQEYGFTLHTITDASIDTGEILDRRSFPVAPAHSLFEHILSLYLPGAESILNALAAYRTGQPPAGRPQNEAVSGYYSLPTPEDFERFIAQGFQILNPDAYYHQLQRYAPTATRLPQTVHQLF